MALKGSGRCASGLRGQFSLIHLARHRLISILVARGFGPRVHGCSWLNIEKPPVCVEPGAFSLRAEFLIGNVRRALRGSHRDGGFVHASLVGRVPCGRVFTVSFLIAH